ncbi:HAD family phosphatase [Nonomuraea sp. NPDC003709]|uniref:HAD family hydrolase n=1 Tax=Nonomuraea sp. NPDC003709 TaxID=3154450 RepID=UPI0033BB8284
MRSEHAGPDAVLFDMDGTLVDTEGLWWQATVSIAASLGRPLGPEDVPYVLGRTVEDVAAHLLTPASDTPLMTEVAGQPTDAPLTTEAAKQPTDAPPTTEAARQPTDTSLTTEAVRQPTDASLTTEVVRQLTDAFADLIGQGVKVTPGASELLAELAATAIPTALVSASPRTIVELVLPWLGHTFDLVIANEDTARGKPYPDPYLEAARRLGTTPSRCVAVEDSPTGVAAATAAGCRVLVTSPEKGLPSLTHLMTNAHPPEG